MQLKKVCHCYRDLLKFFSEKLVNEKGFTASIIQNDKNMNPKELMIFLGKSNDGSKYEVRVYKASAKNIYIKNHNDSIDSYEENDEYISFFFKNFNMAKFFISSLPVFHPEFNERPCRSWNNR